MSARLWTGITCLLLGALSAGWNIYSGLSLSSSHHASPEFHLIRGIATCVFALAGGILLISLGHRLYDDARRALARGEKTHLPIEEIERRLQRGIRAAWVCVGAVFPSLITGTLAQGGSFPILHGVLGFGLVTIYVWCLIEWVTISPLSRSYRNGF